MIKNRYFFSQADTANKQLKITSHKPRIGNGNLTISLSKFALMPKNMFVQHFLEPAQKCSLMQLGYLSYSLYTSDNLTLLFTSYQL